MSGCKERLRSAMNTVLRDTKRTHSSRAKEIYADATLIDAVYNEMGVRLTEARNKGRYGWWDSEVCSVEELRIMRDYALREDDHVSVLNFTAMIALRESVWEES